MSDEQKLNGTPEGDNAENVSDFAAENAAGADPELNSELEALRDSFQQTYNAVAAAAEMPVIQELDESIEPEEPELPETQTYEPPVENEPVQKKPKKKINKKTIICAVANLLVVVLIIAPLLTYFALSVSQPDISDLFSSMVKASSAENASDALSYYKTALTYCKEDSVFASMRQEIIENIVVATAESGSYADAKSYMDENMTSDMKASPKTSEFKAFLQVEEKITDVADNAFDEVKKAVDALSDGAELDADAIVKALDAPAAVTAEVKTAVESLATALRAEQTAESGEDVQDFIEGYLNAYSIFSELGADCRVLLERTAVAVYNAGYAYEALLVKQSYMTEEMLASPVTDEFKAMNAELDGISSFTGDVYELAVKLHADGHTYDEDFTAEITGSMSDSLKRSVASVIGILVEAINCESQHNLTKASSLYTQALNSEAVLGISSVKTAVKAAETLFILGDTATAAQTVTKYISEETANADEEFKSIYADIKAADAAQSAADDIFYPYYAAYASSGAAIDKAAVTAELDALITDSSTSFDKAFVSFYKYYTENFTTADNDTMHSLLLECESLLPDYPFFYGYSLVESYRIRGEYTNAVSLAKKLLEINTADDYANSILALSYRMQNNIDTALSTALYGIENSGTTAYCGYEAAVSYTLKGDYANAFEIIKTLFNNSLTVNTCNLVKLIDVLYDGSDATLDSEITEYSSQVDSIFSNYGYSVSSDVAAVENGTKTAADIFTTGTYDFD